MRVINPDAVAGLVEAGKSMLSALPKASEEGKIVQSYLHAVERVRVLSSRSAVNARRGWENISDRQAIRAKEWGDKAAALLPLVEKILAPQYELPLDDEA